VPGLTLAVKVGFPTIELQRLPELDRRKCLAVPAAPAGQTAIVAMFLARRGADLRGRWPLERDMGTHYLGEILLPSGEHLFLVHFVLRLPDEEVAYLDDMRKSFAHLKDTESRHARFCRLTISPDDGSLQLIEAAVHPRKADSHTF